MTHNENARKTNEQRNPTINFAESNQRGITSGTVGLNLTQLNSPLISSNNKKKKT